MASLTKEERNTVNLKKNDFVVDGENSGILLLKIILAKTQVYTRSTIMLLKKKLDTGMSDIMATHNNNIAGFNAEINEIMQKLQSRCVGSLDLLGQLTSDTLLLDMGRKQFHLMQVHDPDDTTSRILLTSRHMTI
jgi:hypothetical protein